MCACTLSRTGVMNLIAGLLAANVILLVRRTLTLLRAD
jgi:hypothetical protein